MRYKTINLTYNDWQKLNIETKTEIINFAHLVDHKGPDRGVTPVKLSTNCRYKFITSSGKTGETSMGPGFKQLKNMNSTDSKFCKKMLEYMKANFELIPQDNRTFTLTGAYQKHYQVYRLFSGELIGGTIIINQTGHVRGCPDLSESWSAWGCFDENMEPLKTTDMEHDGY